METTPVLTYPGLSVGPLVKSATTTWNMGAAFLAGIILYQALEQKRIRV